MSRTHQNSTARSLVVAGIITAAAMAAPAASQAQTGDGERALLNHIAAPAGAITAIAVRAAVDYTGFQNPVDGERALAVRVPAAPVTPGNFDATVVQPVAQVPITGARALLGRFTIGR